MANGWGFATLILVAIATSIPSADTPSLRTVLERAGSYVVHYGEALSAVVASEDYVQQIVAATGAVKESRQLRSEIAFVRLADTSEWQAFREVISVNGVPVGSGQGRLEQILRDAPRSVIPQARLLAEESARYNLGALRRDFNAPTTAMLFVHPVHQERFRFDKQAEEQAAGVRVWVVRFRERERGTLIRTTSGRDVPVEGQSDCARRRSHRTDALHRERLSRRATRDCGDRRHVACGPAARLMGSVDDAGAVSGPWPDDSEDPRSTITGTATYTEYRRFGTDVRIIREP